MVPFRGCRGWTLEGTARLLLDGSDVGEALNLTGPAALDIRAVAGLQGRPMRIVPLEDYVAKLKVAGKTEEFARQWATTYFGMARGEFGLVDPFLGQLLGRPLRTVEAVLAKKKDS